MNQLIESVNTLSFAILPGGTLGPVLGRTLRRAGQIAVPDERGEAKLHLLLDRPRLELDEAVLLEVLLALLLLLRRVVRLVGGEAPLLVAVLAVDLVVVLGPLHHHHLVDAALASRGDGADVERDVAALPLSATAIVEPNICKYDISIIFHEQNAEAQSKLDPNSFLELAGARKL